MYRIHKIKIHREMIFLLIPFFLYGCGEKVNRLKQLAHSSMEMQKAYQQETKNFNCIKDHFERGIIGVGSSKREVRKRCGDPVLTYYQQKQEKWVYKIAEAAWIDGERFNIFFDTDDNVSSWQRVSCRGEATDN